MKAVTIKLPPALEAKLTSIARRRGRTKSEVVRDALEKYPGAGTGTVGDLVGDLFGIEKSGPSDVSTNPKYFKDFGK